MEVEQMTDDNVLVVLPFEKKGEYYIEDLGEIKRKFFYSVFKRIFDILVSVFALVLLAFPMLVIAILVKLNSPGTVFYFQERLGLDGKKFKIVKFRTMYIDAESTGAQWSLGDDDNRITSMGRVLRKTRLDELPQFWCILKGDMSLIGERGIIETTKKNIGFSRVVAVNSISS